MVQGQEFHSIIQNIFGEVKGLNVSQQLQVNCPCCQEREGLPSPDGKFNLEINTKRKQFKCWKCDSPKFSGSLGKLIHRYGSRIDYEVYKSYAGTYSSENYEEDYEPIQVKLPDEMILFSEMNISNQQHFEAYNYLINERKLSRKYIIGRRLGFCVSGKYKNRVIIPSYDDNGSINYFVARTYDPKMKKQKYMNPNVDKNKIIFNEGIINWDFTVFLVEGGFDVMSLPSNTIPLLGKNISPVLFQKLKKFKPNVVILLDPDAYSSSIEMYYILHAIYVDCEERVRLIKLPTDDDVDELRRHEGIEMVIKSLYSARGLTIEDYYVNKIKESDEFGRGRRDMYSKYFERGY